MPVPTTDIYAAVVAAGVQVKGKSPKNTLSAMLSNSSLFQSHNRKGWTLAGVALPAEQHAPPADLLAFDAESAGGSEAPNERGESARAPAAAGGVGGT